MNKNSSGFAILELLLIIVVLSIIISFVISIKYTFKHTRHMQLLVQVKSILNASNDFKYYYGYMATDTLDNFDDIESNDSNEHANMNFWRQIYNAGFLTQNSDIINMKIINEDNLYFSVIKNNNNYYLHIGNKRDDDRLFISNDILIPEEAFYIDKKIDNGKANSGKVFAVNGLEARDFFTKKVKNNCVIESDYNLKNINKSCQLLINLN